MAVVFFVDDNDRSDGAAAKAGDSLQGESEVLCCFTGGDAEPSFKFVQDPLSSSDMTGSPQANQARMFAAGGEAESAVERGHADGVDEGDSELTRDQLEGFRREIIAGGLDIKKDGYEVPFLTLVRFDDALDFLFLDDQGIPSSNEYKCYDGWSKPL